MKPRPYSASSAILAGLRSMYSPPMAMMCVPSSSPVPATDPEAIRDGMTPPAAATEPMWPISGMPTM